MADTNANPRPIPVNTFGERPVDANVFPIFSKVGFNDSLRLFSIIHRNYR